MPTLTRKTPTTDAEEAAMHKINPTTVAQQAVRAVLVDMLRTYRRNAKRGTVAEAFRLPGEVI